MKIEMIDYSNYFIMQSVIPVSKLLSSQINYGFYALIYYSLFMHGLALP